MLNAPYILFRDDFSGDEVLFDQPPWLAATMLATVALLLRNWLLLLHPQARARVSPAVSRIA